MSRVRLSLRPQKILCYSLIFHFLFFQITPAIYAQTANNPLISLPAVGTRVSLSETYEPVVMKGLTIYEDNPFQFDFLIDQGQAELDQELFKAQSMKMIKYFLAALTVPEEEMWVNLSPYEEKRIIPDAFGQTEMGRDMLVQDYLLKQLTSSLMYPEEEIGEAFWQKIYQQAQNHYGTLDIPVDTFHKVWIIPEDATIYEHEKGAFIVDCRMKVMLEQDYFAMKSNQEKAIIPVHLNSSAENQSEDQDLSSEIIREVIIPAIEKEVNEGETFANLRQIYHSLILATWYKQALKESILSKMYVNQKKVQGVELDDPNIKQKIYEQYVASFKKGVYDFIKEEYDPGSQKVVPRKYFSGGVTSDGTMDIIAQRKLTALTQRVHDAAMLIQDRSRIVTIALDQLGLRDRGMLAREIIDALQAGLQAKREGLDIQGERYLLFLHEPQFMEEGPGFYLVDVSLQRQRAGVFDTSTPIMQVRISDQEGLEIQRLDLSEVRFDMQQPALDLSDQQARAEIEGKFYQIIGAELTPLEGLDAAMLNRQPTILVVDDERGVRLSVTGILEDEGYNVLTATNGQEALEILRDQRDLINEVITDLEMPVLGGIELIGRMQEEGIEIPVVVLSGTLEQLNEAPPAVVESDCGSGAKTTKHRRDFRGG